MHFKKSSAICFNLEESKILSFGKEFKPNHVNPLPNDKILDLMKLKAFADKKFNVAKKMIFLFDRVENIVGKGVKAGYQHFLLFVQYFPKPLSLGVVKSLNCVVKS